MKDKYLFKLNAPSISGQIPNKPPMDYIGTNGNLVPKVLSNMENNINFGLTGKANNDFLDWFVDRYFFKRMTFSELNIYQKGDVGQFLRYPTTKTAYIIEWLNTLQYKGENLFLSIFEKSFAIKADFMSFDDITNQTIEVCNQIYNQNK